jgi:hypothetical protein
MALDFRSILPAIAQHDGSNAGVLPEQLVTICAASLALLIVAAIAILMGMA